MGSKYDVLRPEILSALAAGEARKAIAKRFGIPRTAVRYIENPEKVLENNRRSRAKNPERARETTRRWCARNREKLGENRRRWREANREKVAAATERRNARRAERLANAPGEGVTSEQWQGILAVFGHVCAYCLATGIPLTIDHVIPLAAGGEHDVTNAVPACTTCNVRKGSRSLLIMVTRGFAVYAAPAPSRPRTWHPATRLLPRPAETPRWYAF